MSSSSSSNIVRRLKTAAIAIPIVLLALYFPLLILLVCLVVCFVGLREFAALRNEILSNLLNQSQSQPQSPNIGDDHLQSHLNVQIIGTTMMMMNGGASGGSFSSSSVVAVMEKPYPQDDRRMQTLIRSALGTSLIVFGFLASYHRPSKFTDGIDERDSGFFASLLLFESLGNHRLLFDFGLCLVFLGLLLWAMLSAGGADSSSSIQDSSSSHHHQQQQQQNPAATTTIASSNGANPLSARALVELAFDVLGILYLAVPISFGIMIYNTSVALFTLVLLCNWAGDASALFVGRSIGKHKLYPKISPNKTIEGFCGALIGSMLSGMLFYFIWETFFSSSSSSSSKNATSDMLLDPVFRVEEFMIIGLLVGLLGAAGDLVKSYMKRVARVKDAGNFFGAHGGVIDRIDGLLFAFGPVYFMYNLLMK